MVKEQKYTGVEIKTTSCYKLARKVQYREC